MDTKNVYHTHTHTHREIETHSYTVWKTCGPDRVYNFVSATTKVEGQLVAKRQLATYKATPGTVVPHPT